LLPRSSDYLLATTSGVLLALSFPRFGHPALAWIALAPLLLALSSRMTLGRALQLGLLTGVIYFTGTLYWITRVMAVYGGLQTGAAVLINIGLVLYMAVYTSLFALVTRRIVVGHGPRALLAAPLVWATTELGRTYVLTGFPWVLLGYSQAGVLPIAQLASVFGVYGVSMLVAALSAALAFAAAGGRGRVERYGPTAAVLAVILGVAVWGSARAARADWTRAGTPVRVGLVQGNVDQGEKWDALRASAIFANHIRMTRQAIAEGAELVLWPESSTPFMFEEDPAAAQQIRTLAREAKVPILLGSDQVERRTTDTGRVAETYFNSAFLVRKDGSTAGVYRKMHLVPFGEFVPWQSLLFFAAPLTEQVGTFSPGLVPELLPVDSHPISVAICYEVVYPDPVRRLVAGGSQLLTTITNDAWFGDTSAPRQHFDQAAMRAIENGRYLVRAANTGISGIVDPYGHVLVKSEVYRPAVVVGDARFLTTSTFYTRHGDVLLYAAAIATAVLLLTARRRVQ
jgi:apolipoprotein N-acyltransferase